MNNLRRAPWYLHLLQMLVLVLGVLLGGGSSLAQAISRSAPAGHASAMDPLAHARQQRDAGHVPCHGTKDLGVEGVDSVSTAAALTADSAKCQGSDCDSGQCARLCALSSAWAPGSWPESLSLIQAQVLNPSFLEYAQGVHLVPETPPPIG